MDKQCASTQHRGCYTRIRVRMALYIITYNIMFEKKKRHNETR